VHLWSDGHGVAGAAADVTDNQLYMFVIVSVYFLFLLVSLVSGYNEVNAAALVTLCSELVDALLR